MKYFRVLFPLLVLMTLLASCQEEKEPIQVIETENDQDFDAFYAKFHSDSLYQLDHIQFPLQGISSRPEEHDPSFRWLKEDWRIHRRFDEGSSNFRSEFTSIGDDLIVERIIHKNNSYGMERRFSRLEGQEWSLIYYASLHPIGGN